MIQTDSEIKSLRLYLHKKQKIINCRLKKLLQAPDSQSKLIYEAMRYSVLSEGKRIRPILTLAVNEAFSGNENKCLNNAVAMEMIHAYTLIHDDLPSMDNDDYRRNQLSNHKKFGEAIALLSGNALLTMSFQVMNPKIVPMIADLIGARGLLSGQVSDVLLTRKKLSKSKELISYIYKHKTSLLIKAACLAGIPDHIFENQTKLVEKISEYGNSIGFAFQIVDDVFDKNLFSLYSNKTEALGEAKKLITEAKKNLSFFDEKASFRLSQLADYVICRTC